MADTVTDKAKYQGLGGGLREVLDQPVREYSDETIGELASDKFWNTLFMNDGGVKCSYLVAGAAATVSLLGYAMSNEGQDFLILDEASIESAFTDDLTAEGIQFAAFNYGGQYLVTRDQDGDYSVYKGISGEDENANLIEWSLLSQDNSREILQGIFSNLVYAEAALEEDLINAPNLTLLNFDVISKVYEEDETLRRTSDGGVTVKLDAERISALQDFTRAGHAAVSAGDYGFSFGEVERTGVVPTLETETEAYKPHDSLSRGAWALAGFFAFTGGIGALRAGSTINNASRRLRKKKKTP